MKRTAVAAALLSILMPLSMAFAEVQATYVFTTVDSYDIKGDTYEVQVTGIVQGESAPRTVTLAYYPSSDSHGTFERCERMVSLALSRPGQYLLEMRHEGIPGQPFIGCKLTRR